MNIKDRIAKLLALAESPNEHEAKAALLKARELMAEYKLRPEEISRSKDEKVIRRTTDITCTKMTNTWATRLSAIIASHYCCRAYRTHKKGAKKVTIGFVGLEEDFEICCRIFRYAYDCINSRSGRNIRAFIIRPISVRSPMLMGMGSAMGLLMLSQDRKNSTTKPGELFLLRLSLCWM